VYWALVRCPVRAKTLSFATPLLVSNLNAKHMRPSRFHLSEYTLVTHSWPMTADILFNFHRWNVLVKLPRVMVRRTYQRPDISWDQRYEKEWKNNSGSPYQSSIFCAGFRKEAIFGWCMLPFTLGWTIHEKNTYYNRMFSLAGKRFAIQKMSKGH